MRVIKLLYQKQTSSLLLLLDQVFPFGYQFVRRRSLLGVKVTQLGQGHGRTHAAADSTSVSTPPRAVIKLWRWRFPRGQTSVGQSFAKLANRFGGAQLPRQWIHVRHGTVFVGQVLAGITSVVEFQQVGLRCDPFLFAQTLQLAFPVL
uniref:(northern house mosquito) hypothetical protein n=1 Tax=Culex pipiens TaxID=7175 RepID=A0A8D8AQ35_CULPI